MRKTYKTISNRCRARENRALQGVVKRFGSMSRLAALLGVSYQSIQGWFKNRVPIERCAAIETLMRGQVKCEQLREDYERLTARPYKDVVY